MPMDDVADPRSEAESRLLAFVDARDPYDYDGSALSADQLAAADALFARRRAQIAVLDKRARDLGIERIDTREALVPLLFAHQTYKSYPDSFVEHGRWPMLNRWLSTLATRPATGCDVDGVETVDDWVARLSQQDHHVLLSSGTSGKTSFLDRTLYDVEITQQNVVKCIRLTQGMDHGERRPVFLLGPRHGTHIFVGVMAAIAEQLGRADATYWLSDTALTEVELKRQAVLRQRIASGAATPGEIVEMEAAVRQRQAEMEQSIGAIAEALIRHRDEPVMLVGLYLPHFLLMQQARKLGMKDGEIHPQSTVFVGGGLKGAKLPDDFREQLARFHGVADSRYHRVYGMVELSAPLLGCSAGRYHCAPWIVPMVLDAAGETLLDPAGGAVEGRMAFLDFAVEGRWGGIITGDKVETDFAPCPCGRASPSVKSIARYTDLKDGDDKLSCAGTMASYVRGVIEE